MSVVVGTPKVKVTVYDKSYSLLKLDATADFAGGSITYTDSPDGCAGAELKTGLHYEEIWGKSYYAARNIVEISAGDDTLQAAIATSGLLVADTLNGAVAKVYVSSTLGYDMAAGHDAGQIAIDDGSTLTMRIPVIAVRTDGTGPYLAVGNPVAGGGNPTSIAAYAVGSTIYRRRYTGLIMQRQMPNSATPQAIVRCTGLSRRFDETMDTFALTTGAVDMGTAIFDLLTKNAVRWPELSIVAGNFPTVGWTSFNGTYDTQSCSRILTDLLAAANSGGDQWHLRVGHDRIPRLYKAYTGSSNTYAYNVTLAQGATYFEPTAFVATDQDAQSLYNTVQVIGDTDPATKQPVRAIVQDPTSYGLYGQIDGAPVTNTACKTVAQCNTYGLYLLNQQAAARASSSFTVKTRNDVLVPSAPMGLSRGDVVLGTQNVNVTRFDATGQTANMIPDSEIQYGSGVNALWGSQSGGAMTSGNSRTWFFTGTGSSANAYRSSPPIDVAPGMVLTLSGNMDATYVTAGAPGWSVYSIDSTGTLTAQIGSPITWSAGQTGRKVGTVTIPANATYSQVAVVPHTFGCTATNGQSIQWLLPMLSTNGSSTYVPNFAAPNMYGLVQTVTTTMESGGDSYQQVRFSAVEPDWNAAMSQAANGLASALRQNTTTPVGIDQYCVSPDAFPATGISSSNLVVSPPTFLALFAKGSQPIAVGGNTFNLTASATNWAWLASNGTWTVTQNATPVASSILYAIFTTNASAVIGIINKASVGVIRVGVGNINFGSHPTPVASSSSLATGYTSNSVHAQVNATATITNCPVDGTVTGLAFYYAIHGSTDPNKWKPCGEITAAVNTATQTFSLGFEVGAGQSIDVAVGFAGIGSADYGPLLQIGSAGQISSGFTPAVLLIKNGMLSTNSTGPNVSGAPAPTFTTVASANGLSAGMTIAWTITNQPTDQSVSRIAIYRRVHSSGTAWEKYTDFPVSGLPVPSASQAYSYTATDLTNGQQYDWACAFEDNAGVEAPAQPSTFASASVGLIGTSPAASIVISTTTLPAQPSGTTLGISGFSVSSYMGAGGASPSATIAYTATVTPPGGDPRAFSQWGAGGIYWAKVNDTGTSDGDLNPLHYTQVGSFSGITIPTSDVVGPLPAGHAYQLMLQLTDQQGNVTIAGVCAILGLTTAQYVSNAAQLTMPSAIKSAGPTLSASPAPTITVRSTARAGLRRKTTVTFTETDFTATPGWIDKIVLVTRNNGDSDVLDQVEIDPRVSTSGAYTKDLGVALGTTIDVGIYYSDTAGQISAVTWPSNWAAQADPGGDPMDPTNRNTFAVGWHHTTVQSGTSKANLGLDGTGAVQVNVPFVYHATEFKAIQNRNLVKNGNFQLARGLDANGSWIADSAINSNVCNDTHGYIAYNSGFLAERFYGSGGTSGGSLQGVAQIVNVKPNTNYSVMALMFNQCNVAGSYCDIHVYDTAYSVSLLTDTPPSGTIPSFYSAGSTDAGAASTTVYGAWKTIRGTFNSGARTQVKITLRGGSPNLVTAQPDFLVLGVMLWEGTKYQDFVDGEPLQDSVLGSHIKNYEVTDTKVKLVTSTPMNGQASILPFASDFGITWTFASGTSTMTYYIGGGSPPGTSGTNVTFYLPDGTATTAPYQGTSGSPLSFNAGGTGRTVYALIYCTAAGTWSITMRDSVSYPNGFTAAELAAAYRDGYVAFVASFKASTLTGTTGTAGGGSAKGGGRLYL